MIQVLADGARLPPLFVFKSTSTLPEYLLKKYRGKVLCNEHIIKEWLQKVWLNLMNLKSDQKQFLVLDKFAVHKQDTIKNVLRGETSEVAYIPAGCTGLLQPVDAHCNKPLKDSIRRSFDAWYSEFECKERNQTKVGNLRPSSVVLIVA